MNSPVGLHEGISDEESGDGSHVNIVTEFSADDVWVVEDDVALELSASKLDLGEFVGEFVERSQIHR